MEQLGHVGRRGGGGGRWDFRYSLQTLPRREASVKKKKEEEERHEERVGEEKRGDEEERSE